MYDTAAYARDRLSGTIISAKETGVPFTVGDCTQTRGSIKLYGYWLYNSQPMEIYLKDSNLIPVKLGWVNSEQGISYLTRIPLRRDWKQGLRINNMRSVYGVDVRWISNPNLHNTIIGHYPSFFNAMDSVVNTLNPVAFSRNYALSSQDGKIVLLYKWMGVVGDVVNSIPMLKDEYIFLFEDLASVMEGASGH